VTRPGKALDLQARNHSGPLENIETEPGMASVVSQAEADRCIRCGGLTVVEDLSGGAAGSPGWDLTVRRCVICGDVVDPLILAHRALAVGKAADDRLGLDLGDVVDDSLERKEE
jgi:hypothetical protein